MVITSTRKGTVTREGNPHHEKNNTNAYILQTKHMKKNKVVLKKHTIKRDEWRTLEGRSKEE
jgi:hypothetical protein